MVFGPGSLAAFSSLRLDFARRHLLRLGRAPPVTIFFVVPPAPVLRIPIRKRLCENRFTLLVLTALRLRSFAIEANRAALRVFGGVSRGQCSRVTEPTQMLWCGLLGQDLSEILFRP